MIKNIIFDLGGVLIDWNIRYLYKNVFDDDKEMEYFLANVCNSKWIAQQDKGITIAQITKEAQKEHPKYAKQIAMFGTHYLKTLGQQIDASVQILKELKTKNVPLYVLSNWSHETFPLARPCFKFLDLFDGMVVSGFEKLVKPEPDIYNLLLTRYNLKAEECMFIDDRLENAQTATKLGMKGYHFTSPEELRAELIKEKVL